MVVEDESDIKALKLLHASQHIKLGCLVWYTDECLFMQGGCWLASIHLLGRYHDALEVIYEGQVNRKAIKEVDVTFTSRKKSSYLQWR